MYKLSKVLFALFMINYIWLRRTVGGPAWLNYLLIAGFTITGLIASSDFAKRRTIAFRIDKYFVYWAVFAAYVLVTGLVVARSFSLVRDQVLFLAEILLIILYVNLVGEKDGSLQFFYIVFMVVAALYTLSMLRSGFTSARTGRLYLSENSNPNGDGIILAFGIYSTLKLIDYKRIGIVVPLFALSIAKLYGIFLTGSRKALILATIFFVFGFLRIWNMRKELSGGVKIFLGAVSVAAIAFSVLWLLPEYMSSSAYLRMQRADVGLQDRWRIASDAMTVFYKNPFFGVGINNYKLYSKYGLYAHSTLPELLAGTGILGAVLFAVPYCSVIIALLRKRMNKIDRIEIWRLLICIFAVSLVIIIPYSMPLSFFSVILFFETNLAIKRVKESL